jgi:inorganic pyrophosphatase
MDARELLGTMVEVEIDRPLGSRHPTHELVYEANYGFVPDLIAPDGEFLDAYILGITEPLRQFEGVCVAVIHRLDDDDDKLVVVPPGTNLTNEQIRKSTEFQERFFQSVIIRK